MQVFRKQSTAALSADLLFYCKAAAAALCYYVDLHAFILYCVGAVLVFLLFPYQSNYGSGKVSRSYASCARGKTWERPSCLNTCVATVFMECQTLAGHALPRAAHLL